MSESKAEGRPTRRKAAGGGARTNGGGASERPAPSREATEQALIDGAVQLLRERGILAGMNLREIADEAALTRGDRKSVEEGKSVSVRVDLGGRRIIKQHKQR